MEEKQSKFKLWLKKEKSIIINEFKGEPIKTKIKNYLYMVLGAILLAIGSEFFYIPMNIISGGVSSLGLIFNMIPVLNKLSVEVYILIFNWGFFLLGLFTLGLKYSLKTLLVTLLYPLFIMLFRLIIDVTVVNEVHILNIAEVAQKTISLSGTFEISGDGVLAIAYIVSAVVGGFITGAGVGFAMIGGGSSGGTDALILLAHKYLHISPAIASFIIDTVIIIAGFFVNGMNIIITLVGITTAFIVAMVIDWLFLRKNQCYVALICSKKWEEINKYIIEELERGTTLIQAEGGYSRTQSPIIEVCFNKNEYGQISNTVNSIDPNAFVTVVKASEIVGYGFTRNTPLVDVKDVAISSDEAQRIINKARKKANKKDEEL